MELLSGCFLNCCIENVMYLGYSGEMKNLFAQQKYDTLEELEIIKKNMNKKRARK